MNAINTDKKVQLTYGGLKSSTDTSGADYTIIGIPFDIRTTYRPGTRFGPDGIRRAFSTDSMNEAVGIDTSKYVKGVDYGDLDIWNAESLSWFDTTGNESYFGNRYNSNRSGR